MKTTITSLGLKNKISLFFFLAGVGLFLTSSVFAADITWVGGTTGDWANAANWSGAALPAAADNVTIGAGNVVTLSTDALKINKILVQGKLIVASTGILVVEQSVVSGTSLFELGGGEVENAGSISIVQKLANTNTGLRFADNVDTDDKFTNTGSLNINMTASAITSTTGNCINFIQSSAGRTARLNFGGTITFSSPAGTKFMEITSGNAILDGTVVFGGTTNYLNYRFIHNAGGVLTFASTANITYYSGFVGTNGSITISSSPTSEGIINNGILTLHGGSAVTGYGIYLNPQNSNTGKFTNAGTITIDGNFPLGSLSFGAGTSSGICIFNNQAGAVLALSNTSNTSTAGALMASATPTITFNNAGTMTLNTAISRNMYFGDNSATFNNTGTVTVTKAITGNDATTSCVVNNNAGGVFNFNVSDNGQVSVSSNKKIIFNNNGGTVTGRGQFASGTFFTMTGTLSPGGDTGIGRFEFLQSAIVLTGKCILQVKGKTSGGNDFDQILTNQPSSSMDVSGATLEVTTVAGYTPSNLDNVLLISSVGSRTGNFSSVILPANWSMDYTATSASIKYIIPPVVSTSITGLTELNYNLGNGPSLEQTFNVSGLYLTSDVTVTPPADYEISTGTGELFVAANPVTLTPIAGTIAATPVYVRLKANLAASSYTGDISITSNGVTPQTITLTGKVLEVVIPPVITTSIAALTELNYDKGNGNGPSLEQSFNVSGLYLTGDVTVTPPADYEISTGTGELFVAANPVTLTPSAGTLAATPVYVRLKANLAASSYTGDISITSTGVTPQTVTLTGKVLEAVIPPVVSTSIAALTELNYDKGNGNGPSLEQSFNVSGLYLTGDVTVTSPADYEISTGTGELFVPANPIILTPIAGTLAATPVYVRLKANLAASSYTGDISITSTGVTPQTVTLTGKVLEAVIPPVITTSIAALTELNYDKGNGNGPSSEQSFNVSGLYLTGDVTVTSPADYEISTGTGELFVAANPVTLTPIAGTLAATPVYVRLKANLAASSYTGDISITSAGVTPQTVTLTGKVLEAVIPPVISTSIAVLTELNYDLVNGNGPSTEQSFNVSGLYLTGDITVASPADYEISTGTGELFVAANPVTLTPIAGTLAATPVYVRLKANLTASSYTGDITVSSTGVTPQTVTLTGKVSDTATGVTDVSTGITINVFNGKLKVSGVKSGETIEVFTALGRKIVSTIANGQTNVINANVKGLMIVKAGSITIKVIL